MKKTKTIYLLSPDLKWGVFKRLWHSYEDSGPSPISADKMVWELMREHRLYVFVEDGEIFLSAKPPQGIDIKVIKNGE